MIFTLKNVRSLGPVTRWQPFIRRVAKELKTFRHWARNLRRGVQVLVCYDGKLGRAVPGTVLRARKGVVTVEFPRYAGTEPLRLRFVGGEAYDRGGVVQDGIARLAGMGGRARGDLYVLTPALHGR